MGAMALEVLVMAAAVETEAVDSEEGEDMGTRAEEASAAAVEEAVEGEQQVEEVMAVGTREAEGVIPGSREMQGVGYMAVAETAVVDS